MIEKTAAKPGEIMSITGFNSAQDLCEALFSLLGVIELLQHAYAESDAYHAKSSVVKGRLVGYLSMLSRLKRPQTGQGKQLIDFNPSPQTSSA